MTLPRARPRSVPTGWHIEGLPASGPHPALANQLALSGQFVGDWDILGCRYREDDGSWSTSPGKVHWRWVLDGRAVQDVWTSIVETTGRSVPIGTTVRFYVPEIDAWRSVWLSPVQGQVKAFVGGAVGSEIVLDGTNEKGNAIRWIFSEVQPDSFRWRAEELRPAPAGWVLYEEMRIPLPLPDPRATRVAVGRVSGQPVWTALP
jgi:hypothetical protein